VILGFRCILLINKNRLEFDIAFADHSLKESGIEDMQLIGEMMKFEKNWDKN
jgi:hypothetical protein